MIHNSFTDAIAESKEVMLLFVLVVVKDKHLEPHVTSGRRVAMVETIGEFGENEILDIRQDRWLRPKDRERQIPLHFCERSNNRARLGDKSEVNWLLVVAKGSALSYLQCTRESI
jgi:hypothetical protein